MDTLAKAVVRVDVPTDALSMHKQNPLRITNGNNRIGPVAHIFLLLMLILWISTYLQSLMKFHHGLFKILKMLQMEMRIDGRENSIPTPLNVVGRWGGG